ncbi:E3 ubiquitin-protein ligase TRIM21-like [Micropterus salmoides]|uniref:E3 ubiquitin-protein ligase TRIM21-like n=1 Tax=Micropterus salmoides TaxID=27706 RepID=UPI0018EC72B7|nr:E3 ubiquitin-protein ligase TRIM21-like [Micropterus salmoides]
MHGDATRCRSGTSVVAAQRDRERHAESSGLTGTSCTEDTDDQSFNMSAANYLLTEEQLLCSICLDVFTDPVTLPCGHNFCKNCITQHLNFNSQRQCPMCKERVDRKYKPGINTFISEMAVQFRQSAGKKASNSSAQHVAKPGKVSYDIPRHKRTALKFYLLLALGLVCLTIYFATKVKLHQTVSSLKTDHLLDTEETGSMCTKHGKPLELFCKNEQMPICQSCADSSHRFHNFVPLKKEYEVKKTELRKTEAKIQQKILQRQLKTQEIKNWVTLNKETADREMADGVQVFAALIQSLEKAKTELIGMIEEKQKSTEKQAKGFIQELEQEISELMRRRADVEQLAHSKDHVHFLKSVASLNAVLVTKDWTEVSICPASYEGILRTVMVSAVNQLTETVREEIKKLREAELKTVQQNAVEVTLDPDTAHPALILSDDRKQVHNGDVWKKLPDNSKRFELGMFVLGKQSFSCGRFHYDVEVKGKTSWILGLAKESVNRKTELKINPENGIWAIFRSHRKEYLALSSQSVPLSVNHHPEKVRVFVDYEDGLVSFYDVDAAALLYSFTGCSFTEKLYPFFSPGTSDGGRNSAPLVISPVNTQ